MPKNTLERFTSRVQDYIKYRPKYPGKLLSFIEEDLQVKRGSKIADFGSGTGIFSKQLLDQGYEVFGIEPNLEMRSAAEIHLKSYKFFHSIDAPAEQTSLSDQCVDVVTAAQSFHWFNSSKFKLECGRILKKNAPVVLIWNHREENTTPFLKEYEALLSKFGTDYNEVNHRNTEKSGAIDDFFSGGFKLFTCPNEQLFDFEGLKGRLLSSSYVPQKGHRVRGRRCHRQEAPRAFRRAVGSP